MKLRKMAMILGLSMSMLMTACSGNTSTPEPAAPAATTSETPAAEVKKEIPTLSVSWSNELHTGNQHLAFIKPELLPTIQST